jgi:Ca2+-binding EF-hand superfamily protein
MQIAKSSVLEWLVGIAVATLLLTACASSAPTPEKSKEKSKMDRNNPQYTTVYDAFSRYDTNTDMFLDRHEFYQFQQDPEIIAFRERIPEAARTIPMLFEEIDENGDDRISLDEITVIAEGYIPKIESLEPQQQEEKLPPP